MSSSWMTEGMDPSIVLGFLVEGGGLWAGGFSVVDRNAEAQTGLNDPILNLRLLS